MKIDIPSGAVFGKWTVIGRASSTPSGVTRFLCRCRCGVERAVSSVALRTGRTNSCNKCSDRPGSPPTHGQSLTSTYRSWEHMKSRCLNPNSHAYADYGARGITICERWRASFEDFLIDMGERPIGTTLDRYPNMDGNYEPSNCRWATRKEQQRNRRTNVMVTAFGQRKTVAEWAESSGLTHGTIRKRLKAGWSVEVAVSLVNE